MLVRQINKNVTKILVFRNVFKWSENSHIINLITFQTVSIKVKTKKEMQLVNKKK